MQQPTFRPLIDYNLIRHSLQNIEADTENRLIEEDLSIFFSKEINNIRVTGR